MDVSSKPCDSQQVHVVLFPFMSKGHTIPLLHFAHLLLRHRRLAHLTVFTTPANRPFIAKSLSSTTATIIDLPFPRIDDINIPPGVESTDGLPSMSMFPSFALSTKEMQPSFERELENLPPVTFMVSDGFLWWTLEPANRFGFPRFVFYGMSIYSSCVSRAVGRGRLLIGLKSDDELVTIPQFPWIKVTRNDFDPFFADPDPKGPYLDFLIKVMLSTSNSYGMIVNSFYELESKFADHWNKEGEIKPWFIGPLCLALPPILELNPDKPQKKPTWIQWLDKKLDQDESVLYVAFGSQAELSSDQMKEIAKGLEESNVNFLWVIRKQGSELGDGFKERVEKRGMVVSDWVDQREILKHRSVGGFLSHCGWNSVVESICEGVPILAWPVMAEQPLNARMVVEEIKVGVRVETCNGSVRGFVKSEGLVKMIRELMEGELGKVVRKNVKEFSEMAKKAMKEGTGSSWCTLERLIEETCNISKK